jgi:hypothetical protein
MPASASANFTISQKEPLCGVLLQSKNSLLGPARRILFGYVGDSRARMPGCPAGPVTGGLIIVARVAQLSRRAFLFSPRLAIGGSGQTAFVIKKQIHTTPFGISQRALFQKPQKEPLCGVLLQSKNPLLGPARRILSDAVHRRPYRRFQIGLFVGMSEHSSDRSQEQALELDILSGRQPSG